MACHGAHGHFWWENSTKSLLEKCAVLPFTAQGEPPSAFFSPKHSPITAFLGDAHVHRHPHTFKTAVFGFRERAEWLISAKTADPWSFNSHHHPLQHEPVKVGFIHVFIHSGHKRENWRHPTIGMWQWGRI